MKYIGTKIVDAEVDNSEVAPGEALPGYRVKNQDGMVTWWPKEDFEQTFRPADGMSFGMAIEAAKKGMRIARKGWNGKGMYVFLADGMDFHTYADLSEFEEIGVKVLDCLCMRTADGSICPGWLASQTDMLADDWTVLDGEVCWTWDNAKEAIKTGAVVRRKGWEDDSWVAILEEPAELKGKICKVSDEDGLIEPDWKPEGEDLEARDWCIVEV
jgi:hypothetical protein